MMPASVWNFGACSHIEEAEQARPRKMLKWAFVFLVIAIIAGIFGFTDVEAASATIAQWLFGIFLVLFVGALVIGLAIGRSLTS
jgi:uncharacterized membrane protein YtjA (UPF0391 family)